MDQANGQQQQQQQQQQRQTRPQQAMNSSNTTTPVLGVIQNGRQVVNAQQAQAQAQSGANAAAVPPLPPHIMGLMTNPAFAAAAAASPLFPPAAMLSNPGAYLCMPDTFAKQTNHASGGTANAASSNAGAAPAFLLPNNMGGLPNATQQQQPVLAPVPTNTTTTTTTTPIVPMNMNLFAAAQNPALMPLPIPPNTSSCGPATAAAATSGSEAGGGALKNAQQQQQQRRTTTEHLTPAERAKQNRDRNREHARSTRLRKKAYVQKLKELVDGLHAERTEEVRQRRVAIQHLAETQNVRRSVVQTFLQYHENHETDERKWSTILEGNDFWLRQPVTPYRSFRRAEIEKECRISRGINAVICDAASLAVMVESIGSRSARWMQLKREEFMLLEEAQRRGSNKKMPRCIIRQNSRFRHAISSLSSSSGSNASSGEDSRESSNKKRRAKPHPGMMMGPPSSETAVIDPSSSSGMPNNASRTTKVSSSSGSSNDSRRKQQDASKDFHDYHAAPLPDPKLPLDSDADQSSPSVEDSPEESTTSLNGGENNRKRISSGSSFGDESAAAVAALHRSKRRRAEHHHAQLTTALAGSRPAMKNPTTPVAKIAKKGGIPHNIQSVAVPPSENGSARLGMAPAIRLPPFAGIGKRSTVTVGAAAVPNDQPAVPAETKEADKGGMNDPVVISADVDTSSDVSTSKSPKIRAHYHINEDDMILMDDVLMCPFSFRSQDAVLSGALSECVMPGMLRATFSPRNKLVSVELVYDAMGFMQQLERSSGNEGTAQIVPGSLEMALAPSASEARVVTMASPPFLIVNVNDMWTRMTGYTQMEVEGQEYASLMQGEGTVAGATNHSGKPRYDLEDVGRGRPSCTTNIHYDKDGKDFIEYVCSYPLTNANDEVTHLLHVSKELPSFHESVMEQTVY